MCFWAGVSLSETLTKTIILQKIVRSGSTEFNGEALFQLGPRDLPFMDELIVCT